MERIPTSPSGVREAIALTATTVSTTEPYQDQVQPYNPAGDYRKWLTNRGVLDFTLDIYATRWGFGSRDQKLAVLQQTHTDKEVMC